MSQPSSIIWSGLGLRPQHLADFLKDPPGLPHLEILLDNYLDAEEEDLQILERLRQHYNFFFHSVSMNLAGVDALDFALLKRISTLIDRFQPTIVSDHLCWTRYGSKFHHDLLPFPFNRWMLDHIRSRIDVVQETLKCNILVENISAYLHVNGSDVEEADFIQKLLKQSQCRLLLDVNNLYVNSSNFKTNPSRFLEAFTPDQIGQIHLAGHGHLDDFLIDHHGSAVIQGVWDLFRESVQRYGPKPVIIERDQNIPPLKELMHEVLTSEKIMMELRHAPILSRIPFQADLQS